MKEIRYFYAPDASASCELPEEEAQHATRVLRMQPGDEMVLIDGRGAYHQAVVTEATKKRCLYRIVKSEPQPRQWEPHLHIAMAPTKNMDRNEWFAEKATEIGVDEFSFLRCRWSERTTIKTDRVSKILVAAVKQSTRHGCLSSTIWLTSRLSWRPSLKRNSPLADRCRSLSAIAMRMPLSCLRLNSRTP